LIGKNAMDKEHRKSLLKQWRQGERSKAFKALPLTPAELRKLFNELDVRLPELGCDHTRRITKAWLESSDHPVDQVFLWLDEYGGFCDCEVLANCEEAFTVALTGKPSE